MKAVCLLLFTVLVSACSGASPESHTITDPWSDYCAGDSRVKTSRAGDTLHRWDSDATTAGHRGVSQDDKLGPNPLSPPDC